MTSHDTTIDDDARRRTRNEHYAGRLPVYQALTRLAEFAVVDRESLAARSMLEAAGMVAPDLSPYWQRVDFISGHVRGRVLEVGAATGNITCHIARQSAVTSVVAVEQQDAYAAHLRSLDLPGVETVSGDALTAPLSGVFDCVVLAEFIEHIDERAEACFRRRLRDLLRADATVIITTPIGFMADPDHVRGFSLDALIAHVEAAYGPVTFRKGNGVQQFLVARWRPPSTPGPTVSVMLPTWNHSRLLPTAIDSVLAQTYRDFELIIVDDGSTDDTWRIIDAVNDPRVRAVTVEHRGLPTALNVATCLSRGELITWTSSDNWCDARWLDALVDVMAARPEAAFAFTGFQFVDESNQTRRDHVLAQPSVASLVCQSPGLASFVYRAALVGEVGFYDPELAGAEDWDYWTRLVVGRDVAYVPDVLYYYRLHADSLTARDASGVGAAAREVLRRSLHRLGDPPRLDRVYRSLAECRDRTRAEGDAAWDLGVRVLRSPWADADRALPFIEQAAAIRDDSRVQYALVAVDAAAGRWDEARARFSRTTGRDHPSLHACVSALLDAGDGAALRLAVSGPDAASSELIAAEQARYAWPH